MQTRTLVIAGIVTMIVVIGLILGSGALQTRSFQSPGSLSGPISIVSGNGQATLSWNTPADDGGSAITGYHIYRSTSENGTYSLIITQSGTSYQDTNLTNGQTYWYKIIPINVAGEGLNSTPVSSCPCAVPAAPTGLSTITSDSQATLNWTAPAFNGGGPIDFYIIYQNGVSLSAHPSGLKFVITNLVNCQNYTFRVAAHNSAGGGAMSGAISATPYRLNNGDYIIYSITGYQDGPVNGTERVDFFNVTGSGYDGTTTYDNITGLMGGTGHATWDDYMDWTGYTLLGNESISTLWGNKSVDKYSYSNDSDTWYYYYGHDTGYGLYREDYQSGGNYLTWEITETNIGYYGSANNA